MSLNVKLRKNALLKQDNDLLKRENDLLRDRIARNEQVEAEQEPECIECDMKALKNKRKFLEFRIDKEKRLNQRGHGTELCEQFQCEGKGTLLCLLQDFQILKTCMAEAELADVVKQIWECKTQNTEDRLGCLMEKINCELEKCSDSIDPFVVDHIKDVMKDC